MVKKEVQSFFEGRFRKQHDCRPGLDGVAFNVISAADNRMLCSVFDELEVKDVVWDCGSDKSPGPDGYNFRFLKTFWDVIKVDVLKMMADFHSSG